MKSRIRAVLLSMLVMSMLVVGCGGGGGGGAPAGGGPKDADAVLYIQQAIESTPGIKLTSQIKILEKGQKLSTGDFPVKVEYSITDASGNAKTETKTFNLSPAISDMGANIWQAIEAK